MIVVNQTHVFLILCVYALQILVKFAIVAVGFIWSTRGKSKFDILNLFMSIYHVCNLIFFLLFCNLLYCINSFSCFYG